MNEQSDSLFPIPRCKVPGTGSFDLSPKALSTWVDSLPIAHPELVAERILDAAYEVNRLDIEDTERLRFVTSVGDTALPILRSLQRRLLDVAAPARAKEMKLAELAIVLHQELALAYRSMLQCKPDRKKIFSKTTHIDQTLYIYRGLHHLFQGLKVHYFINVEPIDDIWDKLYGLYSLLDEDAGKSDVDQALPDEDYCCADDVFKAALLLHLSDPKALRGDELDYLCKLLPQFSHRARLIPAVEAIQNKPTRSYLLQLRRGSGPPTLYGTSDCANCTLGSECLLLDVTWVVASVRRRMSHQNGGTETHNHRMVSEHKVLAHLNKRLGVRHKRNSKRISGNHRIDVIAGLQQSHHYFTSGHIAPAVSKVVSTAKIRRRRPNSKIDYNVILNLEQVTIETPTATIPEQTATGNNGDLQELRRARCKTVNFSLGGYCLSAAKSSVFRLSAGEFIAVREKGSKRWLPASVSWLSTDGKHLHFGVNLMAPHMRPGKAINHENGEIRASECMLLFGEEDNELPSRVLMNPGRISAGTNLRIEFGQRMVDLQLDQELSRTHGFVEFSCQEIGVEDISPETIPEFQTPDTSPALVRGDTSLLDTTDLHNSSSSDMPVKHPWKRLT